MHQKDRERIRKLKTALLEYLGTNGRYYGQLTRLEQSVEDLAQALNTRLDQMEICLAENCSSREMDAEAVAGGDPAQRLADRFLETSNKLRAGGRLEKDVADEFERSLDLLDVAADLKRKSESARDAAESAAIRHKRGKL